MTFIRDSMLSTTTNWSRFVTSSLFSIFSVVSTIFIFIFKITNCDLKRFCQTFVWMGYSLSFPLLLPVSSLPPYLHLPIL